jgi:dolichol kinase
MFLPWLMTLVGAAASVQGVLVVIKPKFGAAVARKVCHWATGPVFVLSWLLFPGINKPSATVAASVTVLATFKFVLAGLGIWPDPLLADGMGNTGEEWKLLQGPLQYGVAVTLVTLQAFRRPLACITIGVLCGGDACAALVGSSIGQRRLPWNRAKVSAPHGLCGVDLDLTVELDLFAAQVYLHQDMPDDVLRVAKSIDHCLRPFVPGAQSRLCHTADIHSVTQTWEGSLAFVIGAVCTTLPLCAAHAACPASAHLWHLPVAQVVMLASVVGAAAETVPLPRLGNVDNLLVPISTVLIMVAGGW